MFTFKKSCWALNVWIVWHCVKQKLSIKNISFQNSTKKILFIKDCVLSDAVKAKTDSANNQKRNIFMMIKARFKRDSLFLPFSDTNRPEDSSQSASQAGKLVQPWLGSIRGGISDLSIVILSLNDNGPTSPRGAADGCRVPQSTAPIPHLGPGGPDSRWGVRWSRCHGLGKTQVAHSNLAQTTPAGLWWLRLCFASRPTGDLNGATPQ